MIYVIIYNIIPLDNMMATNITTIEEVKKTWEKIYREIEKVVVGKTDIIKDIMVALLAEGHVLLEGVPGIAKTYITNVFATAIGLNFARAQFTPDLLPSDLLGTNIYNVKDGTFKLRKGAVFTNFLLTDEINRAPPKTQSALLEAMAEKQVSIEGKTYKLEKPFIVVGTQNPIEQEGTYPLPEAQIDRFAFKLNLTLPNKEEELKIIKLKNEEKFVKINKIATVKLILEMIEIVKKVYISEDVMNYVRDITIETRKDPRLILGSSPRGSIALLRHAKANAALDGRNYVTPDDIKEILVNTLHHRIQLKSEFELEGATGTVIITDIMNTVKVPV